MTLAERRDGPVGDTDHHTGHAIGEGAAEAVVRVQAPHCEPATCAQPQDLSAQSCNNIKAWPHKA